MTWNAQGSLQFINAQAARLLHLDVTAAHGKNLNELLTLPSVLVRAIRHQRPLHHVEATFESQHQFVDTVITLKPIVEAQGTSFILLLHPVEKMRQLVTSQLGKVNHLKSGSDPRLSGTFWRARDADAVRLGNWWYPAYRQRDWRKRRVEGD